jgi:hypothetical protein
LRNKILPTFENNIFCATTQKRDQVEVRGQPRIKLSDVAGSNPVPAHPHIHNSCLSIWTSLVFFQRSQKHLILRAWPDDIFSSPKSQFEYILEGLAWCWYILCPFGLFYGHLVYFMVVWYIFTVLVCCTKKNLATLHTKLKYTTTFLRYAECPTNVMAGFESTIYCSWGVWYFTRYATPPRPIHF